MVMLLAIASLSILTAVITSSFIEACQVTRRERESAEGVARSASIESRLDEITERLDRLERSAGKQADAPV